ncbi:fumarate/nitrate reduction transcriptional regulator Fnr [Granulosicoccus antarcticus]|uniref:Transcriptional activator protein Anr n=1 Tax=Granulosicoccus antarcticus IMCC3135 TaxID=1192854 RepID=A0A2Z2NMM0_9GAMM|nr:fumarate/nitrate reduction transcriptional regulator Fnr [Granulosicoccus antarcticus]ASJ72626.1 Transcriptional activator protein Anr [Granulosicoccus antarcticus IMCC3135]
MNNPSTQCNECPQIHVHKPLTDACATCSLRTLCVPGGIPATDLAKLDNLVSMRKRIKRGEYVFRVGDDFNSLYAVRAGFFKTRITSTDGRDQITGFQVPGELLGFEGVATEQHGVDAIALEDSEVCILPYTDLERIAREFPPLQHQLHRIMSREIMREHNVMLLLGTMKAEERVAAFLLNLSERYRHLGYSSVEFVLRMTRQEIGSYLGLKLETVSRTFSKFHEQGLIEAQGKQIKLIDMGQLRQLINANKQVLS